MLINDYTCPKLQLLLLYSIKSEARCSQFDTFWSYLEIALQDYGEAAADDRRHRDAHLLVAISIPDFKQSDSKYTYESKNTTLVPSHECIRLQFLPTCVWTNMPKHAHSSKKFTQRFNIRFKVQWHSLSIVTIPFYFHALTSITHRWVSHSILLQH